MFEIGIEDYYPNIEQTESQTLFKKLKFSDGLPELILSGKKNTTWRINDDKEIQTGDHLSLCDLSGNEFAKAIVTSIKEKTFQEIIGEDFDGHETYPTKQAMYDAYSGYYNTKVTVDTIVKIIKFERIIIN